jgi:hypothetical protein
MTTTEIQTAIRLLKIELKKETEKYRVASMSNASFNTKKNIRASMRAINAEIITLTNTLLISSA